MRIFFFHFNSFRAGFNFMKLFFVSIVPLENSSLFQ